jgi:Ca2+-binding RTX toxin-like protein
MPHVTLNTPVGAVTLSYSTLSNAGPFEAFANSAQAYLDGPINGIEIFTPGVADRSPIYADAALVEGGTFLVSSQTQLVIAEHDTSNTLLASESPALTVLSGTGALTFYGQKSNATVLAGGGGNMVDFQIGQSDAAYLSSGSNTVHTGMGNTTVSAGTGSNAIIAYSGTSTIYSTGNDTVYATLGTENIYVAATPDETVGISHDLVLGGHGSLLFVNGAGASTVYGGSAGGNTIYGGAGGGVFTAGGTNDAVVGQGGAAMIYGAGNGDTLYAGGSAANTIVAGDGNETLTGAGATGSNLFYAAGTDQVIGGAGNDTIVAANAGSAVTMTGGAGADLFSANLDSGHVVITDFNAAAGDRIALTGLAASFRGSSSFPTLNITVTNGSDTLTSKLGFGSVTFLGVTDLTTAKLGL